MSKTIEYLFEHRNSSAQLAVWLAVAAGVIAAIGGAVFSIGYLSQ
jgi:hypothetical protein